MKICQFWVLVAVNLAVAMSAHVTAATVYNLQSYDLTNGYSYSGTLTTDDSVGLFDSADPIIGWNISIFTPDGQNGVREQVLTLDNSSLSLDFLEFERAGKLLISRNEIVLTPGALNGLSAEMIFLLADNSSSLFADDVLSFRGALLNAPGQVIIQEVDGQAFIGSGEFFTPQAEPLVVANAVPLPSAALLFAPSIASLLVFRRLWKFKRESF